jgi:hypothetical protein
MPIARGVAKSLAYKKETTWGTLAGAAGAKYLRRVTSAFNLAKEAYESAEIRVDRQTADMRHGVRSATGSINGELSPASYSDFMQSLVARDFTSKTSLSSLSLTIAGSGPYTITRAAGSWLTDGVTVGTVIRLTGTFNANNLNKNLLVASMTATVLTVVVLNGSTMTAEGPIASAGVSFPGKQTFVPATGHTDDSYTVEEWYSDIAQSEVDIIENSNGRVSTYFDWNLKEGQFNGETWSSQVDRIIEDLPSNVYISFDIDGLSPELCPNTGTPVAGGFKLEEINYLLFKLVESGKKVVGFDLNEVAPGKDDDWDANVGARALWNLICSTEKSRRLYEK